MNEATQLSIDRMVDGELSASDQRVLLENCEKHDHWRELALAYVESQVLEHELGSFERERTEPTALDSVPHEPLVAPQSRSHEPWNGLSLAAAVLLSLGLGYGLNWWWQDDVLPNYANVESVQPQQPIPDPAETMPFLVSDATGSEMRQVTLPLVNASDLGPDWQQKLQRTELPEDLIREFRANGVNVRQQRTMVPVRLPDGRLVVVPIDYFFEELFQ